MTTRIEYEISVSYDAKHYFEGTFCDTEIEATVATEAKGERVASGMGFGQRDLEFSIEEPLTQETINKLAKALFDQHGAQFRVSMSVWVYDAEGEMNLDDDRCLDATWVPQEEMA